MSSRHISKTSLAAIAMLASSVAMVNVAAAQQPSPQQGEVIRKNCVADFTSYCASVQPGGQEALHCLQQHEGQLSFACGSAVSAISTVAPSSPSLQPASTTSQPPPSQPTDQDRLKAVRQACTLDDFTSHCSWIEPSNPELLLCLRANALQVSPSCRTTVLADPRTVTAPAAPIDAIAVPAPAASSAAATTLPPPPAVSSADASGGPSSTQISAIRAACASDFMSYCARVQPEKPDALQCLERNKTAVSPACQAALAGLGGSAEVNPESAMPFAGPAPAAPRSFSPPPLRPRQALVILRACAPDAFNLCGNIPPGDRRVIACLAQNASRLGPQCQAALAKAGG